MPDTTPAIRATGLTRDFGAVRALDGVELEVPRGIVFGLLGPNGAGKTTMIRLLLGLLEPTAGSVRVLGRDPVAEGDFVRERTGALLEHTGIYERLSAEHNLEFYARVWHLAAAERARRIHELLDGIGLWERRGEQVGGWSRGMKQKLAVARTLLHRPELVFLDEPTAGLDPRAAFELRHQLADLAAREGVTVLLTTHNLAEAEQLCHRIGVIRGGRLVALGTPEELRGRRGSDQLEITGGAFGDDALDRLRERADVRDVRVSDGRLSVQITDGATAGPIVVALVEAGATVEEVRRPQASLEDVFLELTLEQEA